MAVILTGMEEEEEEEGAAAEDVEMRFTREVDGDVWGTVMLIAGLPVGAADAGRPVAAVREDEEDTGVRCEACIRVTLSLFWIL